MFRSFSKGDKVQTKVQYINQHYIEHTHIFPWESAMLYLLCVTNYQNKRIYHSNYTKEVLDKCFHQKLISLINLRISMYQEITVTPIGSVAAQRLKSIHCQNR